MKGIIADFTNETNPSIAGAKGDVLLRTVDENTIILQMFRHHQKNINMGLDDTRAPFFHDGIDFYKANGYTVSTRNSGGRSVANDKGVLNFSLIMQNDKTAAENYLTFYNFLKDALEPLGLTFDVGEVKGAYCPGKFDISVNGKKVCGTAQRRIGNRILVGGYLSVNGDQLKRSQIIADFYKITQDTLVVSPDKLTTLQDELHQDLSTDEVKELLFNHFKKITSSIETLDEVSETQIQASLKRAQNQNTKYLNR